MPRGRHRHSPPLHRLLPPSAIAGVSLVCAFGPWVFSEPAALRVIAAFAAATAVIGAAVMRRWDAQAGKQVADLTRARASDEWRHEERVAELETDLEESRELRAKLEQRLRAKRAELAGLRNEHAALLRRYATAETERASALEGRRLLEIEAAAPDTHALPPVAATETEVVAASAQGEDGTDEKARTAGVFSPEGSQLFLRAKEALKKFDDGDGPAQEDVADDVEAEVAEETDADAEAESVVAAQDEADAAEQDEAAPEDDDSPKGGGSPKGDGPSKGDGSPKGEPVKVRTATAEDSAATPAEEGAAPADGTEAAAQEDEAQGQPVAVDGHEHAAATTPAEPTRSAQPVQQPSGHFVAPTAVAVVPATPARRPAVEGGFDFFGTKQETAPAALDAVQNEDLADVVGQEALAVHKAEAEAQFKPADEDARGVGQVIDLTAHDETERIDLQGLRSAVS
ncbi:hypothetical protein [Streptomyces gilvus]|uniref:hypothetical protein n=1 Tax=Streptomyces gilvus TaxID=2920937 RepID=UPI001F0E5EF2|nr:hypothetical protein [Streptomyces sp. CME 23]MCH5675041.1 hypothetical protein [Streptomyces sp. CME 23]